MNNFVRNISMKEILYDPMKDINNLSLQFPMDSPNHIINGVEDFMIAFEENLIGGVEINHRDHLATILNYFEEVIPQYTDAQFYSHFRMSRGSVEELENIIRPHVLNINNDVPLQKKILITIWTLATPYSFRSIADRFGLPKSAAHAVFEEIVDILSDLLRQYVRWPDANECELIETGFCSKPEGFPGIIGAIDGCHIEISQPPGNANDYYN